MIGYSKFPDYTAINASHETLNNLTLVLGSGGGGGGELRDPNAQTHSYQSETFYPRMPKLGDC